MILSARRSLRGVAASDGLLVAGASSGPCAAAASVRYVLPIAALAASYWVLGRNDFGTAGDEGGHLGIATQLIEHGQWPLPGPFLAGIKHYPPAAHALAAVLGELVGSTVNGIFVVIAAAFAVIYFALAELMRRAAAAQTVVAVLLFVLLAVCLRKFRFVTGNEMANNFFFAQFAGTACLLAGTIFLARLRWALVPWLAFAVVAVHVTGWFYPLSAAELAVAGTVLRLRPSLSFSAPLGPRLVEASIAAVVLGGVAVIHPAIIDMVAIAANDGEISVTTATVVACALVMILVGLPTTFALSRRSGMVHGDALAALAAAALVPVHRATCGTGLLWPRLRLRDQEIRFSAGHAEPRHSLMSGGGMAARQPHSRACVSAARYLVCGLRGRTAAGDRGAGLCVSGTTEHSRRRDRSL